MLKYLSLNKTPPRLLDEKSIKHDFDVFYEQHLQTSELLKNVFLIPLLLSSAPRSRGCRQTEGDTGFNYGSPPKANLFCLWNWWLLPVPWYLLPADPFEIKTVWCRFCLVFSLELVLICWPSSICRSVRSLHSDWCLTFFYSALIDRPGLVSGA